MITPSPPTPPPSNKPLQNVWKVGSRWSYTGTAESSILDLFRRNNIVFTNVKKHLFANIKEGDLITISDGKKVVALGLATTPPAPVTHFPLDISCAESELFTPEESVIACKVSFIDLKEEDYVSYRIGGFHGVNDRADQFRELFKRYYQQFHTQQGFEINARSCTLLTNPAQPSDALWKDSTTFEIPVYQRAYSWGDQQVRRLLNDLLTSFFGRLGRAIEEPMFVGTMQLSAPVPCDIGGATQHQNIIDGQQRSTTLILLLKALHLKTPSNKIWDNLRYTQRIHTSVNGGVQQDYLSSTLDCEHSAPTPDCQNPYQKVLHFILSELDEDELSSDEETIQRFVHYLVSKVYFVVIETRASLSKTLQIFDAINTSGMDLNGGDVFKVRYYEFLREKTQADESSFDEICALYTKIDERNRGLKRNAVDMEEVLRLAQQITITQYGLSKDSRSLAGTTFFERFFDTALNVNRWDGFNKSTCDKVQLPLDLLDQLIELLFSWHEDVYESLAPEARSMSHLIWWTRYGRYHQVQQMFRYRFTPTTAELETFITQFSKLLTVVSVRFQKAVREGHNYAFEIMSALCSPTSQLSQSELIARMRELCKLQKDEFIHAITHNNLAHIPRAKNLLCRISSMRDELKHMNPNAQDLHSLLFDTPIDIEHIESANHEDLEQRTIIHQKWGDELHRLGNLVVLEQDINRSISNGNYQNTKVPAYIKSKFVSVRHIAKKSPVSWTLEKCIQRKTEQAEKLTQFLCG